MPRFTIPFEEFRTNPGESFTKALQGTVLLTDEDNKVRAHIVHGEIEEDVLKANERIHTLEDSIRKLVPPERWEEFAVKPKSPATE